jgi:hypothetical protein
MMKLRALASNSVTNDREREDNFINTQEIRYRSLRKLAKGVKERKGITRGV